ATDEAREKVTDYVKTLFEAGEKDTHRLTVCGLTYLRQLDGSADPVKAGFTGLEGRGASARLAIPLELPQRRRLLAGAGHDVCVIRSRQDELRAEADVLLHGVRLVDAAHAEEFTGLAACRADAAIGFLDARMQDLAGNPHRRGQVGSADQQGVDPLDRGNTGGIGDAFRALDHRDHEDCLIDGVLRLGVSRRLVTEQRWRSAPAPRPQRRIAEGGGDAAGLIDRIDMRHDDAGRAIVERAGAFIDRVGANPDDRGDAGRYRGDADLRHVIL